MTKRVKKPIKARRRWVINPKTKVEESKKVYARPNEKKKVKKITESI